jgi:hypothetical protein
MYSTHKDDEKLVQTLVWKPKCETSHKIVIDEKLMIKMFPEKYVVD